MGSEDRRNKISEAISKVASADIGAFCNISDASESKIMITVENSGEADKVNIVVQGDLSDDTIAKIQEIIEKAGGDTMMMQILVTKNEAVDIIEKIFSIALGSEEYDVNIELALE